MLLPLLLLLLPLLATGGLTVDSGSDCTVPGGRCREPQGGVCVISGAKLACQCEKSQTVVKHESGYVCQTKLLDIHCRRDKDAACQMVRNSVCAPHEARCVCPQDFAYVPHRHQCKPQYLSSPQHQFCKICKEEGGICVKEDELTQSTGPLRTEGGATFRLSCACPAGRGVAPLGAVDSWTAPVCSTRLRDIGDSCNDQQFFCRSKRAVCRKPRHEEANFKKCQCPDGSVPVYQPWLKYYECFERLNSRLAVCSSCSSPGDFGVCYAVKNSSETVGCLCPKRMSTPNPDGNSKVRRFCSKKHVSISCQPNRMVVTFDPNYDSAPYNELKQRLSSGISVAFVEAAGRQDDGLACKLEEADGVFKAVMDPLADSPCGRRVIRQQRLSDDQQQQLLQATLRVMWNRNFFSYPDIVVQLKCRVSESSQDVHISARRPDSSHGSGQPPSSIAGISLAFRVLNSKGRTIQEVELGELIRLDVTLEDAAAVYSSMLVQECHVSNKSELKGSRRSMRLIGCGGRPDRNSGFTAGFHPTRPGASTRVQTGPFPAFRLNNLPSLYFHCLVRICKEGETRFCSQEVCQSDKDKMTKRSPDDGVKEVEKEVQVVVIGKQLAKRAENYSLCQYSMCLSTSQVIVIILILLVLLALISGLVIVVYRRRLMLEAHRLRCQEDETPMETPIESHGGKGACPIGQRLPIFSSQLQDTLDSGIGVSTLRAYAPVPLDRTGKPVCHVTSALLDNRPDVCTCDRSLHSSYSITSSQV